MTKHAKSVRKFLHLCRDFGPFIEEPRDLEFGVADASLERLEIAGNLGILSMRRFEPLLVGDDIGAPLGDDLGELSQPRFHGGSLMVQRAVTLALGGDFD